MRHPGIPSQLSKLLLVLVLLNAATGYGELCNRNPLKPSMLPPCLSIADKLTQAHEAAKDFVRGVDLLNTQIASARSRFWKAFPSGPGLDAAEMAFLEALRDKDEYYLSFCLIEGVNGRVPKLMNFIDMMGGGSTFLDVMSGGDAYKKFPTNVDSGIRPYAFPLFVAWVDALRKAEGRETDGNMATPFIMASAILDKSNWRKAYEDARNWAEFISSGVDVPKYVTPQIYLLRQMEADLCLVLAAAKPADLPEPTAAALAQYNFFVKMFGEKEVLAAAGKVLRTPKNSVGGLAKRADVAIGPYVMPPHPSPYLLFLTEVTNASPRNYAISLCIDAYGLPRVFYREKWADAFSVYNQLVAKYGEANMMAAATRLKAAPKDSEGRLKGDPQYNRQIYWFDTLLKNPKATLPGAVPHFRASSYDPRWLGKTVEVRGTVSRVDLDQSGSPKYATIHFKEAGAANITGYSPHSDMLQEMYGENFSALVGKVVEVYGEVNPWKGGAGVRIIDRDQVNVLDASALGPDFKDSQPDWWTAAKPAEILVDSPQYLAWKKFPPGTTVAYVDRLLYESQPGSNLYTRSKTGRTSLRLDSIDDKQAILTVNSTVYQMNGRSSSSERQINYQAKQAPGQSERRTPNESGQETLEISGKKIATHWERSFGILAGTFAQPDKQKFVKTWTSDDVPGGLVLKNQQDYREVLQGQTYRSITQTILESVENVEPEFTSPIASEPAAQPGVPNRVTAPASTVANQPVAKPAPGTPASSTSPTTTSQPETRSATTTKEPDPAPPSTPKRRFGWPPMPAPAHSASSQVEFAKQYSAVMVRASRARGNLNQLERRQASSGTELPENVSAARDRLDVEMRAVAVAMRTHNSGQAEQSLHAAEDALATIEQFLAK
uniref:Uncharacterized protein n=1 Tax=uncultured marine bacterium PPT_M1 TaxID=1381396 RepID=A0A067XSQ9_9BACT|nr:hypothetical protein PPT_M1_02 [uncultured marine bacterium PPT_M1]